MKIDKRVIVVSLIVLGGLAVGGLLIKKNVFGIGVASLKDRISGKFK